MNYNVTDNREVIENYFIEQDTKGRIHIYIKESMEYIEYIDCITVVPHDVFLTICKNYVDIKGSKSYSK